MGTLPDAQRLRAGACALVRFLPAEYRSTGLPLSDGCSRFGTSLVRLTGKGLRPVHG